MIDSKVHALAILEFALHKTTEREKNEIISSTIIAHKRFGFSLDEDRFFSMITSKEEGQKFIVANRIGSLEELVFLQFEYRMKYEWMIYKNVYAHFDLNEDDLDGMYYLD